MNYSIWHLRILASLLALAVANKLKLFSVTHNEKSFFFCLFSLKRLAYCHQKHNVSSVTVEDNSCLRPVFFLFIWWNWALTAVVWSFQEQRPEMALPWFKPKPTWPKAQTSPSLLLTYLTVPWLLWVLTLFYFWNKLSMNIYTEREKIAQDDKI